MNNRDYIRTISEIGMCLQTMIKTRYGRNTKLIYTNGKYKSLFVSFYRSPHVFQFFVEDRHNYFIVYLLKNEKIIRREVIPRSSLVEFFYKKMILMFKLVN